MEPAAIADVMQRQGGWGVAAMLVLALVFERRQNMKLQRWLVRVSTAGLKVSEKDVTA